MSSTWTLDDDPVTGTRTKLHYDAGTETFRAYDEQRVSDIHRDVKEIQNAQPSWGKWKGDWHHIGKIPNNVYWKLWQEGRLPSQDKDAFKRWWNERQNQEAWATKTGRL